MINQKFISWELVHLCGKSGLWKLCNPVDLVMEIDDSDNVVMSFKGFHLYVPVCLYDSERRMLYLGESCRVEHIYDDEYWLYLAESDDENSKGCELRIKIKKIES